MAARNKPAVSADIKHTVCCVVLHAFQTGHVGRIQLLKPICNATFSISKLYQPVDWLIRDKKRTITPIAVPNCNYRSTIRIHAFYQSRALVVHKLITECHEYSVTNWREEINRGGADKTYALAKRYFYLLVNLKWLSVVVWIHPPLRSIWKRWYYRFRLSPFWTRLVVQPGD